MWNFWTTNDERFFLKFELRESLLNWTKLDLPDLLSHSQDMEWGVKLTTEAAQTVYGFEGRHQHITASVLSQKFNIVGKVKNQTTLNIYIYIYIYIYHHHHVVPPARISQTLSRLFSLLFIASSRSSRLHPMSSHSCCMYVWAGRPGFAWPYVGFHRTTSLMSSSLLLQQCPACLVRLTCIVFLASGRIVGVSWGVVARTCSILTSTFLCNCRLVSSPAV